MHKDLAHAIYYSFLGRLWERGRRAQAWHSPAFGGVDLREGLGQTHEPGGGSNWREKGSF